MSFIFISLSQYKSKIYSFLNFLNFFILHMPIWVRASIMTMFGYILTRWEIRKTQNHERKNETFTDWHHYTQIVFKVLHNLIFLYRIPSKLYSLTKLRTFLVDSFLSQVDRQIPSQTRESLKAIQWHGNLADYGDPFQFEDSMSLRWLMNTKPEKKIIKIMEIHSNRISYENLTCANETKKSCLCVMLTPGNGSKSEVLVENWFDFKNAW